MLNNKLLFSFPLHCDARGTLGVADTLQDGILPFAVQRVFWITNIPQGASRGGHAHRTCHEALVCVSGSCEISLTTSSETLKFVLDNPGKVLHIPPKVWCRLHSFSTGCALLCFASEPYDASGYIHDIESFKRACQT